MVEREFLIVGGGLVGSAIAYGLAGKVVKPLVVDEGDVAYRASRGNFGLVWIQGKGAGMPDYLRWSMYSAQLWPHFSAQLQRDSGIDVCYRRTGGLDLCIDEVELKERQLLLARLQSETSDAFVYRMLDNRETRNLLPVVSSSIAGASFCEMDGFANPLLLLRALRVGMMQRGAEYRPNTRILKIVRRNGGWDLFSEREHFRTKYLILASGLGGAALAQTMGYQLPLRPQRGEILVTERLAPFMPVATSLLRQTNVGTVIIGDSHEEVGFDDGTDHRVLSAVAARAVRCFPLLRHVQVVRGWSALRILTPDGFPIYHVVDEDRSCFIANCHSGVTLAAAHAIRLSDWVLGSSTVPELDKFTLERFNVSKNGPLER